MRIRGEERGDQREGEDEEEGVWIGEGRGGEERRGEERIGG